MLRRPGQQTLSVPVLAAPGGPLPLPMVRLGGKLQRLRAALAQSGHASPSSAGTIVAQAPAAGRDASGGHQRSRPQPLPWSSGRPLETSDASGKSGQRHDKRADAEHSPAPANGMVVSRGPGSGLEPNPAAAVRRRFGHLAAMLQCCWQLFTPEAETRSRSRSRSPRLPWVPGRVPRARRGKPAVCPLLEEWLDDWCTGVLSAARVSRYCAAAVRRPPSFAALLAPD